MVHVSPLVQVHILVVDDDPGLRQALEAGPAPVCTIHGAATGAEACALLEAHEITRASTWRTTRE